MNRVHRELQSRVQERLTYFPVTAILGPRQCGKTTLAKAVLENHPGSVYLDLERPSDAAKLTEAEDFLRQQRPRLICLDEIQRAPNLFKTIRALLDETQAPGQFLVLGSASPELLKQSSETLAGRIAYLELTPFTESEVGAAHSSKRWFRGGFARSFLAPTDELSRIWLDNFVQTFLERDLPQLGVRVPATHLHNFWQMTAHLHGDLWNHEKVASALGVTGKTVSHYVALLEQTYMLRRLPPYSANIKKRLVKSPRVYLRDSGLLHRLLRIEDANALFGHPSRGVSWEGYVLEQIAAAAPDSELYFYRTAAGAEIDLLVKQGRKLIAIEMKATSAPRVERGFWIALEDTQPDQAWIAAHVEDTFPIDRGVLAAPLHVICDALRQAS